jgi:hypothetical protein
MTIALIAIVGLVVLSPFALATLDHFRNDWQQLSDIGQTYGAVSAILSSLALGGVVASLLYQARSNRNAYEQIVRTLQLELIKMELKDPSLMTAMGAPWDVDIPPESESIREFLYVQLWVSFWGGNYTIGELPESAVRHFATHELFRGRAGRTYWAAVGPLQIANSKGRLKHFFQLLDDEYKKVISSGIPAASPVRVYDDLGEAQTESTIRARHVQQVCIVAAATIIAASAGRFWRCKRARLPVTQPTGGTTGCP